MSSHITTHEPVRAATTVAWSEVVVGDRRRPVKIVGLPAFGRQATRAPRRAASGGTAQPPRQREDA